MLPDLTYLRRFTNFLPDNLPLVVVVVLYRLQQSRTLPNRQPNKSSHVYLAVRRTKLLTSSSANSA